jgi:hypothetical protein
MRSAQFGGNKHHSTSLHCTSQHIYIYVPLYLLTCMYIYIIIINIQYFLSERASAASDPRSLRAHRPGAAPAGLP